jgi:hypothetical protein
MSSVPIPPDDAMTAPPQLHWPTDPSAILRLEKDKDEKEYIKNMIASETLVGLPVVRWDSTWIEAVRRGVESGSLPIPAHDTLSDSEIRTKVSLACHCEYFSQRDELWWSEGTAVRDPRGRGKKCWSGQEVPRPPGSWNFRTVDSRTHTQVFTNIECIPPPDVESPASYCTESARYACRAVRRDGSFAAVWKKRPSLVFSSCASRHGRLSVHNVRTEAWYLGGRVTNANVAEAASIFRYFRATAIFDPSMGWGDRMAAAVATPGVERLFGCSVVRSCHAGLGKLRDCCIAVRRDCEVAFDTITPRTFAEWVQTIPAIRNGTFDLAFSRPMWWHNERHDCYFGTKEFPDTWIRNRESWINEYWVPYFSACVRMVRPGGHIVLHMSDVASEGVVWVREAIRVACSLFGSDKVSDIDTTPTPVRSPENWRDPPREVSDTDDGDTRTAIPAGVVQFQGVLLASAPSLRRGKYTSKNTYMVWQRIR